jgi:hypothetical protein
MTRFALFALMPAALALSACGSETPRQAAAGTAEGDVLPGAASDAMLPYDSVRSQAPLAPKSESTEKPDGKAAKKADKPAAASPAAEAEPASAPASDPSP